MDLTSSAESPEEPIWRAAVAWLSAEAGGLDEARTTFDAMATAGFDRLARNGNWITTVQFLATHLRSARGHGSSRQALRPTAPVRRPRRDHGHGRRPVLLQRRALGALATTMGRLDDAAHHFEGALRRDAASRTRSWMVMTARDYARMLARRRAPGDVERARQVVDEALITARAAGMTRLAGQLDEQRP